MKRLLAVATAVALLTPLTAQASEECPDPARPIHYMPFCFSQDELTQFLATQYETFAPTPVSVDLVERWRPMVAYYWPAWAVDRMLRIMDCESGGVPTADNPISTALGLFQIMGFWQKAWPGDYTDPWTNGAVAYQIWLSQGWGAWVCKGY